MEEPANSVISTGVPSAVPLKTCPAVAMTVAVALATVVVAISEIVAVVISVTVVPPASHRTISLEISTSGSGGDPSPQLPSPSEPSLAMDLVHPAPSRPADLIPIVVPEEPPLLHGAQARVVETALPLARALLVASLPTAQNASPVLPRRICNGAATCVPMLLPSRLAMEARRLRPQLRLLPLSLREGQS